MFFNGKVKLETKIIFHSNAENDNFLKQKNFPCSSGMKFFHTFVWKQIDTHLYTVRILHHRNSDFIAFEHVYLAFCKNTTEQIIHFSFAPSPHSEFELNL